MQRTGCWRLGVADFDLKALDLWFTSRVQLNEDVQLRGSFVDAHYNQSVFMDGGSLANAAVVHVVVADQPIYEQRFVLVFGRSKAIWDRCWMQRRSQTVGFDPGFPLTSLCSNQCWGAWGISVSVWLADASSFREGCGFAGGEVLISGDGQEFFGWIC